MAGPDGKAGPKDTICYVCGPPKMTDELVDVARGLMGSEKDSVFFEKWW